MSIPNVHVEFGEKYVVECYLSNAAYHPAESPHKVRFFYKRFMVTFL